MNEKETQDLLTEVHRLLDKLESDLEYISTAINIKRLNNKIPTKLEYHTKAPIAKDQCKPKQTSIGLRYNNLNGYISKVTTE